MVMPSQAEKETESSESECSIRAGLDVAPSASRAGPCRQSFESGDGVEAQITSWVLVPAPTYMGVLVDGYGLLAALVLPVEVVHVVNDGVGAC